MPFHRPIWFRERLASVRGDALMASNYMAAVFLILLAAVPSHEAKSNVIFQDDFESYGNGFHINVTSEQLGNNWTITDGTVDYIAPYINFLCQNGTNCIDLDGDTNDPGRFATTFAFNPGTY